MSLRQATGGAGDSSGVLAVVLVDVPVVVLGFVLGAADVPVPACSPAPLPASGRARRRAVCVAGGVTGPAKIARVPGLVPLAVSIADGRVG
ncbi:hypothetical protein [Streptomyces sp. NPDC005423]|uniref:hypothetical protein n=1 Tax=Streptomyces sp. NPDC005423 TaxID=3155343 RepID=UPI0033AC876F